MRIGPGLSRTFSRVTRPAESAAALGSGGLEVFSTPSLVALFEITAKDLVDPLLDPGHSTVGVEIAVKHLKATPIGQEVRCTVVVTAMEGKRIHLTGEMWDEQGRIGEGTHTRYVVNDREFLKKLGLRPA
jgi:predicted thioesterase